MTSTKKTPAEAAVVEANPDPAPEAPTPPEGMVTVPFRGLALTVPAPSRWGRSYRLRMAAASGDDARLLAALVGDHGTRLIATKIDEDKDDFDDVVAEFFVAYNEVTGSGNS